MLFFTLLIATKGNIQNVDRVDNYFHSTIVQRPIGEQISACKTAIQEFEQKLYDTEKTLSAKRAILNLSPGEDTSEINLLQQTDEFVRVVLDFNFATQQMDKHTRALTAKRAELEALERVTVSGFENIEISDATKAPKCFDRLLCKACCILQ